MGLRIAYDSRENVAVLYDSCTGTGIGPVFHGDMAQEQAESYVEFVTNRRVTNRIHLRITSGPGGIVAEATMKCLHRLWEEWYATAEAKELCE